MNGSNAVNHVEVESLQEPVTSNNMPNLVDKTVLEMLSRLRNATNKIVQVCYYRKVKKIILVHSNAKYLLK